MRLEDTVEDKVRCSRQAARGVEQGWMVTVETTSIVAAAGPAVVLSHRTWAGHAQLPFPGKEAGAFRARLRMK